MGKKTVLTPAKKGFETLRSTVPVNIVRQFSLKAGDKFEWLLEVKEGEITLTVKIIKVVK